MTTIQQKRLESKVCHRVNLHYILGEWVYLPALGCVLVGLLVYILVAFLENAGNA